MKRSRIRNAYTKAIGKEWYKKMMAAKQAKSDKTKRDKMLPTDLAPKVRPLPTDTPKAENKRLEVTEQTPMSAMEQNHSTNLAIEKALNRLREQAKELK